MFVFVLFAARREEWRYLLDEAMYGPLSWERAFLLPSQTLDGHHGNSFWKRTPRASRGRLWSTSGVSHPALASRMGELTLLSTLRITLFTLNLMVPMPVTSALAYELPLL